MEPASGDQFMNKDQVKDRASEEKGKVKEVADKVTDEKRTEQKGSAEKHGGKDETVLKDINDGTREEKK
jgi:uncharacterized protein YjbJ (UPF0337 family)